MVIDPREYPIKEIYQRTGQEDGLLGQGGNKVRGLTGLEPCCFCLIISARTKPALLARSIPMDQARYSISISISIMTFS